jgi:hypothetical protein
VGVGEAKEGGGGEDCTILHVNVWVSCAAHCGSGTCMAFVGLALYIGMSDSMHQSNNE